MSMPLVLFLLAPFIGKAELLGENGLLADTALVVSGVIIVFFLSLAIHGTLSEYRLRTTATRWPRFVAYDGNDRAEIQARYLTPRALPLLGLALAELSEALLWGVVRATRPKPERSRHRAGETLRADRGLCVSRCKDAYGQAGGQAGAPAGRAADVHLAAEGGDAVGQATQAGPIGGIGAAGAVVGDRDLQRAVGLCDVHTDRVRSGVLRDVRQRF